jgi:uncharacterized protein
MKDWVAILLALVFVSTLVLLREVPVQQATLQHIIFTTVESPREVSLKIPAVDSEGNGVLTMLTVGMKSGSGKALVDINQLLFWIDTQYSIQVAKKVAEKVTHANLSNVDLFYRIETNASIIEGPSAGAALTVATIAVIEGKQLNESVVITGTINEDGTIGPVGGILAKAEAAKEAGATLFLVPSGQSIQTTYRPVHTCEKIAHWTVCRTEYKREVTTASELGIEVVEVKNVEEALKYFLV